MSNPFDQFDAPTPKKGAPAAPQGGSGNPFDQFDAPKAAPAQKAAQGPSGGPSQPYSWGQMGKDALRDYLDTLTFGLGDRALGLYTGQDEAANTEAAKSRLGLWGLLPEAAGYMTNPLGDLGIGAKVAGKLAPSVERWAAGALGSAASGAAITGAQDIGHGQMPTAGDLLLGAGVGGAAGGLADAFGRSAVKPAITSAADMGKTMVKPAAATADAIKLPSQPLIDDLRNVKPNLAPEQVTNSSEPEALVNRIANSVPPQMPAAGSTMTPAQFKQFQTSGGVRDDVSANALDSWSRDFAAMKDTNGANQKYIDVINNHLANATPTSGHPVGAALDASNAIRDAGAQQGFARTLEDMAQKPRSAPDKAGDELYNNSQFYQDPNTNQLNNYGQALQNITQSGSEGPSYWMLRHLAHGAGHLIMPAIGAGVGGYEGGGESGAVIGAILAEGGPLALKAYLKSAGKASALRAINAAKATATTGPPSIGGPLVNPDAFLGSALGNRIRGGLQQGALGVLAGNAPGSQPSQ